MISAVDWPTLVRCGATDARDHARDNAAVIRLIVSSLSQMMERLNTCLDNHAESYPGGVPMRYHEIVRRPATTDSYSFVADIILDQAVFEDFERKMEARPDVQLLAGSIGMTVASSISDVLRQR